MKITIEEEGKEPIVFDHVIGHALTGTQVENGVPNDFRSYSGQLQQLVGCVHYLDFEIKEQMKKILISLVLIVATSFMLSAKKKELRKVLI